MFDIDVCEAKQVVLIRFSGELTESDFARLDRMAGDARGNVEFDCIFDFTAVERVDLATEFVAKRGDLPQAFKDRESIYVVPQDDLKLLTRLYAAYQTAKGWRPPTIVVTLHEALGHLGVTQSDFHPRHSSPSRSNAGGSGHRGPVRKIGRSKQKASASRPWRNDRHPTPRDPILSASVAAGPRNQFEVVPQSPARTCWRR
jgi:hypothetical protein